MAPTSGGNIINGIDLGHRMGTPQLYALTSPLLTTASGAKMGKSMNGAVWLNADMLSAYDFWQYWRNTEDADIGRFLKLYTTLPMDEIARLETLAGSEINEVKKLLATEVTAILHGRGSRRPGRRNRAQGVRGRCERRQPADDRACHVRNRCRHRPVGAVRKGRSRHFQRRSPPACAGGAVRINDVVVTDEKALIGKSHLNADGVIKLSLGKKKHVLVKAI